MGSFRDLLRRRRAVLAPSIGAFVLGLVVGAASLTAQPDVTGTVGPGTVSIDPSVRGSATVVDLPPLGRVRADSHRGPLRFDVRVERIDLDRAGELAGDLARGVDPGVELREEIQRDLRPLLWRLAWQGVALAALAGVVAGLVLPVRRARHVAATALGSLSFVAVSGALAFTSFAPASFDEPEFEGTLAAAPDIVSTVQRHIDDVDVVETRLAALSDRLVDLYRTVEGAGPSSADVVVLHVSDLHSNPVGIELVEETAERFGVDAIIDSGDLTSFGTSVERAVVARIARIDVPYHVVPGNHDHAAIRRALVDAGVSVLDGDVIEIGGIRVLGVGEPMFTADNKVANDVWDAELAQSAVNVRDLVRHERPDVVAVHNPRQLERSTGLFEVGLAGHVHAADLRYEDGSVVVEAGSAGATGFGALMADDDLPYQMQLLQFEDGRLVAVDRLEFRGTAGAFRLERVLVDPGRVAAYPDVERVAPESGPLGPLYRMENGPR